MQLSKEKLFFAFLLLFSLVRFFYKIGDRAMFEYDQEFLALEAKKIVIDKKLTLIGAPTSIGGIFIAPLYSYLAALLMWLFKMNPFLISFLTAFWGTTTIVGIYLVSLDSLGFPAAFFASLTALSSFYFLDGIPPLTQPLALTSILIFWMVLRAPKDKRYLFLISLLIGWAFNLHFSAIFFPVLIAAFFILDKTKLRLLPILISLLILLVFLLPLFQFELRHNFFMSRNFLGFLKTNTGFKISLLEGIKRSMHISFEHLAGVVFFDNLLAQLVLIFLTLVSAFGALWQRDKKVFKAFCIWLFVPILFFSFYKGHIIPYYFTLQEVILFPALGLFFARLWQKKPLRVLVILFFFVFMKANFHCWFSWQTTRSLKNKIAALEFIKTHSQGEPIYLSHTMEPGVDGGFSYLEWYSGIDKREDEHLPIYTLIAPLDWQGIKPDYTFGDYGVNLPR